MGNPKYRRNCADPNDFLAPKSSLAIAGALTTSTSSLGFDRTMEACAGANASISSSAGLRGSMRTTVSSIGFEMVDGVFGSSTMTDFGSKRNEGHWVHANRQGRLAGVVEEEFNQKRLAATPHPQIEAESRRNVRKLLAHCADFKAAGHGQECSALYGRARGLDVLYNRRAVQTDGPDEESSDSSSDSEDEAEAATTAATRSSRCVAGSLQSMASLSSLSPDSKENHFHHHHHRVRNDAEQKLVDRAKVHIDQNSYFKGVEQHYSGTTLKLAKSTGIRFDKVKAGSVFFRQGDPGCNCYIVVAGAVEVFKFDYDKERKDGDPTPTPREGAPVPRKNSTSSNGGSLKVKQKAGILSRDKSAADGEQIERWKSLEGLSSFSEVSIFGDRVTSLGQGVHFGELALLSNAPRAASIKASQDCEVLVIPRAPFQKCTKHIKAKMDFFHKHFPGLEGHCNYDSSGKHVTSHFHLREYSQGHMFLWEGVRSMESHVYVVHHGTLDICRYANASDNPTYVLAGRPLDRGSWRGSCTRPMTGVAGSTKNEAPVGVVLAPDRGAQVTWDRLGPGDVLCSLSFIPVGGTEPFAAVAAEDCVVYHAGPRELSHLSEGQSKVFQKAAVRSMSRRLRKLDKSLSRGMRS